MRLLCVTLPLCLVATGAFAQPPAGGTIVLPRLISGNPTTETIWAAWPIEARKRGIEGDVLLSCTITVKGTVEDCKSERQGPDKYGFSAAAIRLTQALRYQAGRAGGQAMAVSVQIPVRFRCGDRYKPAAATKR